MHVDMSYLVHQPVFWITVSFVLVVGLIVKKLVPLIITGLDKHRANIAEEIDRAAELHQEAQGILKKYRRKEQEVLKEAEEIIQKANLEARRITREAEAAAEANIKKHMKMAVEKIHQAEKAANQEVQARIIDMTIAATQTLLKSNLTPGAQEKLISEAAGEIAKKLH
jgi:F-type H+-transporting ATPase subunit b